MSDYDYWAENKAVEHYHDLNGKIKSLETKLQIVTDFIRKNLEPNLYSSKAQKIRAFKEVLEKIGESDE